MRVVQLGPVPPPHGGVSINMLAIHDALIRFRHDSKIIDVTNRSGDQTSPGVLKPRSTLGLLRMLLTLDYDIVHYHIGGNFTAKLALLTWLCGVLPGKRSVVTFHSGGYTGDEGKHARPLSLRGFAFRSIDLLIGVNDQMISMFRSFGAAESRTRLILPFELKRPDPSAALPSELADYADKFDPFLLSVGALEPEYLNDFLIRSMPLLLDRFPDAGLVIAGSGSREAELKGQIASAGLDEKIVLVGNVGHEHALHLIDRADVLLRITEYDGDAISVREALYLRTPVIASDNAKRPKGVYLLDRPFTPEKLLDTVIKAKEAQATYLTDAEPEGSNAEKVLHAYEELLAK